VRSPEEVLWKPEEAATYLGIKTATVYAWVERGSIPFLRIGGRLVRFNPSELVRWAQDQRGDVARSFEAKTRR
jgi:excisionase family DNA binding protein